MRKRSILTYKLNNVDYMINVKSPKNKNMKAKFNSRRGCETDKLRMRIRERSMRREKMKSWTVY